MTSYILKKKNERGIKGYLKNKIQLELFMEFVIDIPACQTQLASVIDV